jgi:methylmalonyl-CoA mutase
MSSPVLSFPLADQQQWQDLVTKALKGVAPDSLHHLDEDGLDIAALYQIDAVSPAASDQVPVHRLTAHPAQRLAYGWRVCQPVETDAAPETVNAAILDELAGGATGIYLNLGSAAATQLEQMLHDVVLGAADIVLDAGPHVGDALAVFAKMARGQGKNLSDISLDLAIDPFAPQADAALLAEGLHLMGGVMGGAGDADITDGVFRLNGWQWHNHGLSQVQELAYLLAAATQIFRSGTEAGLPAELIARKTSMSVALPADMFDGIAKCRALRRGWAGLVTALGLRADSYPLHLQALPSMRMFSLADADMNIMRTTTALLGGAMGGADMMTAYAHDVLTGGSAMGRRLARMQQIMMIEESGLGRSLDAAGGAAFIEARTEALAAAAWAGFQDIEAAGGAAVAQAEQRFAAMAEAAARRRDQQLAQGKLPLLGITVQPDSKPVGDLAPRWQMIARPAAVIEAIRRQSAKTPPRILILQQGDAADPRREAIRRVLRIGGMSAVHLTLPLAPVDAVTVDAVRVARPAIVVLLDLKIDRLNPQVREQLDHSILPGGIFEADDILPDAAQIAWLIKLADMTKDLD